MKYFLAILSVVFAFELSAQQAVDYSRLEVKSINKANQLPSSFVFSSTNQNRPSSENLNAWFQKNLSANEEFNLVNIKNSEDAAGFKHLKYQQLYKNIPVEGSILNTHLKDGAVQSMNGNYYTTLNVNTVPALNPANALSIALARYGNVEFAWNNPAEEAFLKQAFENPNATYYPNADLVIISNNYSQKQEDFRLAYKFNIYMTEPLLREMVYVDAINGDILYTETLIQDTDVKGSGLSKYSGTVAITCDSMKQDSFILRETGKGNGIQTYNGKSVTKLDTNAVYTNKTGAWDLRNVKKDEVAIDVQWGMEQTYDFYKKTLGINSINDSGYKMMGVVHFKNNYNNASWNGQMLNFGDGDGITYKPLTSIDICGHEMTHGLTQKCAGLIYKNESGGLNESFSDIFGKCIEHYAKPDSFSWLLGEQIHVKYDYFRSMKEPTLKNNPKYYLGQYFVKSGTPYDNGGVHINSGIQNYWFYLLCEGGSGVREGDMEPFTVQAIGWEKATAIAYSTLSNYLTPTSEFFDASDLSQLAASNLYGAGSFEEQQVFMAWYGVGLATLPISSVNATRISKSVLVSPNPSENHLKIELKSNEMMNASITDITGKSILTLILYNGADIDISGLEKGVYLLNFKDGSSVKFIKI